MQDDHPYDMVDTETASLFHRHTHHTSLVQDQTKYYYGEKRITSHRRHSKLLYIICLHLRNRLHAKSYSTSHAGQWRYNYYNTSGTTANSDSSIVVLIEVTSIAWKFNMTIREQTVLRSLWTIGARMRSWTNKRWPAGTTGWGDASHITPIHHVWQS